MGIPSPATLGFSHAGHGKPVVADTLRALPSAPVPCFTATQRPYSNLVAMSAMCEESPPRFSWALAPGRVGCGRTASLVCKRANLTRAAYDDAQP